MIAIDGEPALEAALASPLTILVKDSPRCIHCAMARRQLRKLEKRLAKEGRSIDIYLLDVLEQGLLSKRVARDFGIRHESPQALVLRRGELLWHGSHFAVTWRKLAAQIGADG